MKCDISTAIFITEDSVHFIFTETMERIVISQVFWIHLIYDADLEKNGSGS